MFSPSITNIPPINCSTSNIPTVANTTSTNNTYTNISITNNNSRNASNSSNRASIRSRRRGRYLSVKQKWDFNNPCRYCGCLHLKSNVNYTFRKKCCNEGRNLTATIFPKLLPLPPTLKHLIFNDLPHFSRHAITYNNMLALGKRI